MIFPVAFSFGLDPAAGAGLIFETLPVAFGQMTGGRIVGALFFLLLSVAAVTSMVGFLEPVTAWLEQNSGLSRRRSALTVAAAVGALSSIAILGHNHWAEVRLFGVDIVHFVRLCAEPDHAAPRRFADRRLRWLVLSGPPRPGRSVALASPLLFRAWHGPVALLGAGGGLSDLGVWDFRALVPSP